MDSPRAKDGRAPDVFRRGGWIPMRCYRDQDEVDFAIVGTGAGGGTLACKLAEAGFSVVGFDAGPFWRPLEDFASDEYEQEKLYWLGERITGGDDPIEFGSNNSGQSVGGSTVHFQMVSLRFRPERFKARSRLGYAVDWPIEPEEMWHYYDLAEDALKISGPVNYPWGPPRPRYPYRQHEMNAAALVLARGCEALGIKWAATPFATIFRRRAASRLPASIAASARAAARPMPSRAHSLPGSRARSMPAPKFAISQWLAASMSATMERLPGCNIIARANGAGSGPKMSWLQAMLSKPRGYC